MLAVTSSMFGLRRFGAHRLRNRSRARRHAAARAGVDGRAIQRSGHGGRWAADARDCAVSPRRRKSRFAGLSVLRSDLGPVYAAGRGGRRRRNHHICAARRCGRRAAIDEVRRSHDRSACRRPARRSSLRILRRRRAADSDWSVLPTALGFPMRWRPIASTPISMAIRRVRALVRVRPARTFVGLPLADLDVRIDVSPRNLNLQ